MQVTQENRSGSRIGLTIVVEASQVQKAYEKTLRQLTQTVQVQGFRKGKAPRNVVIRSVGKERVKLSTLDDLINDTVREAIKQLPRSPVGTFQMESGDELFLSFDPDSELTFTGSIEVLPEPQLGAYTDLTVSVTRVDPDPAQIDATIDRWRDQRSTLSPVEDRPAQLGDVAFVDFQGVDSEGKEIPGSGATDFQLDLQEANFVPGFVVGVVGMALGETRTIEVEFPEDYYQADLAGKPGTFTVTLNDLKAKELPELDDQFVQEISDLETVAEMRESLERRHATEALAESETNLENAILAAIISTSEIELPEALITDEINNLLSQSLSSLTDRGMNMKDVQRFLSQLPPEQIKSLQERFRPDAEDRLKRTLTLGEIIRRENITVGNTELEVRIQDFFANYQGQEKLDPRRVQQVLHEQLLSDKVMGWLRTSNTAQWLDKEGNPVDPPQFEAAALPEMLNLAASDSEVLEVEFTDPAGDSAAIETVATEVVAEDPGDSAEGSEEG